MLAGAAVVQVTELLIPLAAGGLGRVCCAEEVCMFGGVAQDTLPVTCVAEGQLACSQYVLSTFSPQHFVK